MYDINNECSLPRFSNATLYVPQLTMLQNRPPLLHNIELHTKA